MRQSLDCKLNTNDSKIVLIRYHNIAYSGRAYITVPTNFSFVYNAKPIFAFHIRKLRNHYQIFHTKISSSLVPHRTMQQTRRHFTGPTFSEHRVNVTPKTISSCHRRIHNKYHLARHYLSVPTRHVQCYWGVRSTFPWFRMVNWSFIANIWHFHQDGLKFYWSEASISSLSISSGEYLLQTRISIS